MSYVFDKNDIFYLNLKLSHKLRRRVQNKFKAYDISFEQWYILHFIYQNEGCNQNKLSKATHKDSGAMTRSLNTLENKGLIERKKSYHDKREYLIYLTDKGKDLYNKTSELMSQNAQEIKSIFSESELRQYESLLNKLDSYLD